MRAQAIWQFFFYTVPLSLMLLISVRSDGADGIVTYARILRSSRYVDAVGNSALFGIISAFAAVAAGLPLAYTLHHRVAARRRRYLLLALALPFLSSYVLRMYGWQAWFNSHGIIVWLAQAMGGIEAEGILYTQTAAVLGLISVLIPIATLVIYLSLARTDPALVLAARNLGATPRASFLKIELPFLTPAILVSSLFCFLMAFGDFVTVSVLGGNNTYYYSIAIQDQVKVNNWPMACALGAILLAMSIACMAVIFALAGRTQVGRSQAREP